jgi:transposase InsO family protein
MRQAGLPGVSRAKGPRTTVPGSDPDTRPDLVDHGFRADAPDWLWDADITYCRTFAGWVYTAFVIECSAAASWAGSCRRACAPTSRRVPWRWACGPDSARTVTRTD